MYKVNAVLQHSITRCIDWFYPPFKKILNLQMFRYAVVGGVNIVLNWILYYTFYHFVFNEQMFHLQGLTISAHIASFLAVWPITFVTGFWLQKFITFSESQLHSKVQLQRYFLVVIINIMINYLGLKFFVEICGIFATPSQMITTIITIIFSYFANKYYSFKA